MLYLLIVISIIKVLIIIISVLINIVFVIIEGKKNNIKYTKKQSFNIVESYNLFQIFAHT